MFTRTRETLTDALKSVALKQRYFGLHALNSGIVIIVGNSGVLGRLFEKHGSWKSEKNKYSYIDGTLTSPLSVKHS